MSLSDDYKDSKEYADREKRFRYWLERRENLESQIKLTEEGKLILEYIRTYYTPKDFT